MNSRFHHALTALASLLVLAAGYGCSSEGSSFDMPGGGSGNNPTGVNGGSGNNPTGVNGGSGNNPTGVNGGTGNNPTGVNGGTGNNPTGGTGNTSGGTGAEGGSGGTGSNLPVCPKGANEICHEFIANDNAKNEIKYVNEFTSTNPGAVVWSVPVGVGTVNSPRSIEIVDNALAQGGKAILVSLNTGYGEFDLTDGKKLAEVKGYTGVTGACRLPDGTTALGTNNTMQIVSAGGAKVRDFALPAGADLRSINRHPTTGNFWLSKTQLIFEVSDTGQVLWQANMGAGTKGYAVWWREGGGAYGTTGDPSTVIEIDKDKQIVSQVGGKASQLPLKLDFFSGFVRLASGNYVVANWTGHLNDAVVDDTYPHVIELTPANKVIWKWGTQAEARQITNVYVLR